VHNCRRVLVIDDEPSMLEWVGTVLRQERLDVKTAARGRSGEELFHSWSPDVVVTDLLLPDLDGLDVLQRLKRGARPVEVIVLTGHASVPKAVEAMRAGAFAFVEKPIEPDALAVTVKNALEHCRLRSENQALKQQLQAPARIATIVGRNAGIHAMLEMVRNVAPSDANCLIVGENGTGKELVANTIHALSTRAKGPFIKVNCAAIPADLIESELFGHKKGSFTGAIADREGLLEKANGGSLLLDEIGEMPPYLQTKLLRVLQERAYRPIGSDRIVHLDFRLICATNADVDKAIVEGRLREDLYFRINTITLKVPALRERVDDVPVLCEHFLDKFRRRYEREIKGVSSDAMHLLMRHRWPGNVRELENVIERAVLLTKGNEIKSDVLPDQLRTEAAVTETIGPELPAHMTLDEIERLALLQTLRHTRWNKQEAAQILGLYRPTLYSKMKKHAIEDPRRAARAEVRN
jgi:DNA-binding NtrC family response regulator